MLLAWLLAVAVGAALGYSIAQRAARTYWQKKLDQDLDLLHVELDASRQQVAQLRQENADLHYRIGEADKARRHAESRLQDRGDAV